MTQQSYALKIKALSVAVLAGIYSFQVGGCTSRKYKSNWPTACASG